MPLPMKGAILEGIAIQVLFETVERWAGYNGCATLTDQRSQQLDLDRNLAGLRFDRCSL